MNDSDQFSDIAITETIREEFAKKLEITRMLVRNVQVAPAAFASVFRAKGGNIYILIKSEKPTNLGEVKKIIRGMGVEADAFLPPGGVEEYFTDQAKQKYKQVFPGKRINSEDELRYYKTLVPYNPALVRVAHISSEIREYDPKTRQWNAVKYLNYRKINTSE